MDKKICVIGGGRWGKNHIRTLAGLGCLAAVVEADAARLKEYTELYPGIKGYADMDEAIACGYDGYTVALPAELHPKIPLASMCGIHLRKVFHAQ